MGRRPYPPYVKAIGLFFGVITLILGLFGAMLIGKGLLVLCTDSTPWQEKAVPLVFLGALLCGMGVCLFLLMALILRVLWSPLT